jgi:hypothetical protein
MAWSDFFGYPHLCPIYLLDAIESHMGQWGSKKPFNNIDRCVHMADYMASRNFIEIPQIVEEYQAITKEFSNECLKHEICDEECACYKNDKCIWD